MTKANSLLKKAQLFEKLAVHGSRRAYLRSLAFDQEAFDAALSATKKYLADAKNVLGGEASIVPEPSDVDQISSQIDRMSKLLSVLPDGDKKNRATSDLLGARTSLKKTKELAPQLPTEPTQEDDTEGTQMMPAEEIKGKSYGYPSVPKDIQQAIGLAGAQVDGILGPETRRRLDVTKLYYKLPSNTPDVELYKKIRGDQITKNTPF